MEQKNNHSKRWLWAMNNQPRFLLLAGLGIVRGISKELDVLFKLL
jgi:hypothetical protein